MLAVRDRLAPTQRPFDRANAVRPYVQSRLRFELPSELEAREPPEARGLRRDEVRLLVSYRQGDHLVHTRFTELHRFLEPGDLLVVNVSATIPAALTARRSDGTEFALHLSTRPADDLWLAEPRKTLIVAGERVSLPGGGSAVFEAPFRESWRLWTVRLDLPSPVLAYLAAHGRPVTYPYVRGEWPIETYQTVYTEVPGSAEMPSAGRPFSERVLRRLASKGVGLAKIVLHTGVASLEKDEAPYAEWFEVPEETADVVNRTRCAGGRVVAVGTTVVRALESAVAGDGKVHAMSGWTGLVITPDRGVRAIDGLLTGFHEPKATHLEMLSAIAPLSHLQKAYTEALHEGYLWHEFGDMHLIL